MCMSLPVHTLQNRAEFRVLTAVQEALNEMNEELQENARETELELREERDNTHVRLGEVRM